MLDELIDEVGENEQHPLASLLGGDNPLLYHPVAIAACGLATAAILWSFRGESYRPTPEEQLEDARQRGDAPLAAV